VRTDSGFGVKKPELRILVIGRVGSGKTTLINTMNNFLYGKRYTDERTFIITQLLELFDPKPVKAVPPKVEQVNCHREFAQQQSDTLSKTGGAQTQVMNRYRIEFPQYTFAIIDTPGIESNTIIQNIVNDVIKFGQLHAIFYVHRDGDVRQDPIYEDIYRDFSSLLHKFKDNFFVIFTRCDPKRAIPQSQQFLTTYGYPMAKRFRFELSCLSPEPLLRKNMTNSQEADTLVKLASNSWVENKAEFDLMMKSIQELVPKLMQVSQTSFKQQSMASLKQSSVEDDFLRQYTAGGKTAVDPAQDPQQEIYSCSQLVSDEILKYYTERNNKEQHRMYDQIRVYFTRILTAMNKVREQRDLNYLSNTLDSRLSVIERDPGYAPEYKSGLKDLMQRFRELFETLKLQIANQAAASANQPPGPIASANSSFPTLDYNGGYYRSAGSFEGTPNVREKQATSAPKYINPQVSHLNLFLS
jgi:GTPase SAR1 family protein